MNTTKIYFAESGRIADVKKDFPLYQGQYNDKLLNIYVPTSILAPRFQIQHYIGQIQQNIAPTNDDLLDFVRANTYPERMPEEGDIIEFYDTNADIGEYPFYVYICQGYNSGAGTYTWTYSNVDSFGTYSNISGTSIKVGMLATKRDGSIYKSKKAYQLYYLKTLTYQNVEYALYERKLPKEFTSFVGQGENAPELIMNVVNVDTSENQIESIVTSQTCHLDVMRSDYLEGDEPIEPTEYETLYAIVNQQAADIELKQDKKDNALNTTSKFVVGGINELKFDQTNDRANIIQNSLDIAQNKNDIDYLYEHMAQAEEYIGQMTGSSLPTDAQLTAYVETVADREPKNADVIIYILQVTGGADKTYKYIYSIDSWNGYEIPPFEEASNDTLGTIKGTYSVGSTNDTLVNISGGEILDIYVKDGTNTYRNIREYLNTTTTNINNIISGDTSVGVALKALSDGLGNNIVNTYLTQVAGATKQYVKDYALPRTFNDIYYPIRDENDVNKGTYSTDLSSASQDFTLTTSAVGSFTLCELTLENTDGRSFELSKKNSCQNSFHIFANRNCICQFRLTTTAELVGESDPIVLGVELSNRISLNQNTIQKIDINTVFSYLGSNVIKITNTGDKIIQKLEVVTEESTSTTFTMRSSGAYNIPATFNLNTTSLTIYTAAGMLGEQPVYELTPVGEITASGINLIGASNAQIYDNTECMLKIIITNSTIGYTDYFYNVDNCQILSITLGGQQIRLVTPYNYSSGQPTFAELDQTTHTKTSTSSEYLIKCFIQNDGTKFIVDEDNISSKENISNKVTSLSSGSTNTQYPSAKCVYDQLALKQDKLTTPQQNAVDSGIDSTKVGQIATNTSSISTINGKIPAQASSSNQLADKNFVNSSIATNTANFIGTFVNVTALNGYSGTITNNDYANVTNQELDFATTTAMNNYDKTLLTNYDYAWVENGAKYDLYRFDIQTQTWGIRATNISKGDVSLITAYNRYTYNGTTSQWAWNYTVNTSGFTAAQWAAINSGATADQIAKIGSALLTTTAQNLSDAVNELNTDKQSVSNLVTTVTSNSTDSQYPSAKCVYDLVGDINTALTTLNSGSGV